MPHFFLTAEKIEVGWLFPRLVKRSPHGTLRVVSVSVLAGAAKLMHDAEATISAVTMVFLRLLSICDGSPKPVSPDWGCNPLAERCSDALAARHFWFPWIYSFELL